MRVIQIYQTQLYTIIEFSREEYLPIVIWDQRKRSQKGERFIALSPVNLFVISEGGIKTSSEVFSNSFSLSVDA